MKRNIFLLVGIIVFSFGFWFARSFNYAPKPARLEKLEEQQTKSNEKLITSQILSQRLDRVYKIFETNLTNQDDRRTNKFEITSMEFLNELTDILEKLEIKTLHLEPQDILETRKNVQIPYELEIQCTYEKFGKFITELEKNDHIITIQNFTMKNGIERISTMRSRDQLLNLNVEMELSTIILKKITG
ncbi:MAG: type 4a pilus biogenesis protein PilO [FCB group bacterium]|nr:type 4a pilus biogenesis protein PilO [FCB group bacterium]